MAGESEPGEPDLHYRTEDRDHEGEDSVTERGRRMRRVKKRMRGKVRWREKVMSEH